MWYLMAERILVLAVDSDNDLYRKARITGPVTGRIDNLKAAAALALADPQDVDANTMFEAVRKFDELKKMGYPVSVATITGAEKEGYVADAELSRQIELIIDRYKSDACVLVTDGKSDSRVLPLLKSRMKVNSVDMVRMKQAEALENTYFTIFEKLKEPHYARIVFGIPAVLLILFAVSYYFNFGWQLPAALIGIYLVMKGFGLEESLFSSFRGFGFSVDRLSFVFYVGAIVLFVISLIVGFGSYSGALTGTSNQVTLAAYAIEGFLMLAPMSLVLYLAGRVMDLESKRMRYRAITQGTYVGFAIIAVALMYLASSWLIGQIYFWQLLVYGAVVLVCGYAISVFSAFLRRRVIARARVKDKEVINDTGAYIGKVTKVDAALGFIFVKTDYGNVIRYEMDRVTSVTDRVVVR
jgi:putative membrane protein